MIRLISIVLAFFLDLMFGDPSWLYHPVRLIGNLIHFLGKWLRRVFPKSKWGEQAAGVLLVIFVCSISTGIPTGILYFLYKWNRWAGFLGETFFCFQLLALKSLKTESMKVYASLSSSDVKQARKAVSMIVGRDTEPLDERGIIKAAVETVAENASDGVAAPLFYMMLFGAPGAFFYKGVNTMDSMVGYKSEGYRYFGMAAAKTDDLLNFIPARICGILIVISAGILGYDKNNALRIFIRDRKNHASPNSAHGEAAMAGALQIELGGPAWYFGKLHQKLTIGDDIRPVEPEDIVRANRILYGAGVLALMFFGGCYMAISFLKNYILN